MGANILPIRVCLFCLTTFTLAAFAGALVGFFALAGLLSDADMRVTVSDFEDVFLATFSNTFPN